MIMTAYFAFTILAAADLKQAFTYILGILMMIGFIWGVLKVKAGWAAIDRGEEGGMKILGGVGILLSPIIMFYVAQKMGLTSIAIDPGSLGGGF